MQERLRLLRERAVRHARADRTSALPRVQIHVQQAASMPTLTLYQPILVVVLQGAKEVMIGDRRLRYDTASYFVGSIDLPAAGCVIDGSEDKPYIAVSLTLDLDCLTGLLGDEPDVSGSQTSGFAVSAMTPELLDAWSRMLALIDTPGDIAALAPLIEREMLYRVLHGPQGGLLRQAARQGSRLSQVRQAIGWLREHFDQPVRVDALAAIAGMSVASFHRHFRAATAMTPLQYQKALRLQEARRLLVADHDAARVAFAVGYESASQFSREYSRMFGLPPARDAGRLRHLAAVESLA
ncbi:AraC family transcriptional regulator [Novosphingobium sp. PC22D]|uniref:AraC family transcriptional regulator n=1 Tax=Novosphingobium sp. PC22D TaxID=1962403 RepID=UPI000BF19E07|nr:AraC family transcriptional regulator [Novosphingobium sp. PC22D]PEQ14061.1 AraC family transcriptional regulator [Novosphingobium sp. PC22D]